MKINDITTFYDKILIVIIIIVSLVMLLFPLYFLDSKEDEELNLLVQQDNKIVREIPIADSYDEPIIFEVEGPIGIHIIEVNNGRVRVKEAPKDDPLKICEKTGWIDREGPTIVCVPNKLSLWIESDNSDIDGMSW
ncbi:MAG: NusG domain II-containing protein [Halanaerobium sp.]